MNMTCMSHSTRLSQPPLDTQAAVDMPASAAASHSFGQGGDMTRVEMERVWDAGTHPAQEAQSQLVAGAGSEAEAQASSPLHQRHLIRRWPLQWQGATLTFDQAGPPGLENGAVSRELAQGPHDSTYLFHSQQRPFVVMQQQLRLVPAGPGASRLRDSRRVSCPRGNG